MSKKDGIRYVGRCDECKGKAFLHPDPNRGYPITMNTQYRITCLNCGFGTTSGTKECVREIWRGVQ